MTANQATYIGDLLDRCEARGADVDELQDEVRTEGDLPGAVTVERASEIITELELILHEARR